MSDKFLNSVLVASGSYLPERILTNDELSKTVDTNDEWITDRTGIKQRHIAAAGELTSDLAAKAAQNCLDKAIGNINSGVSSVEEIDMIIVATTTPDLTFPSVATIVQKKIAAKNAACFDVQAVCSGFIYALTIADSFVKTGRCKNILVIGAEKMSSIIDWNDRSTCILFGDGASCFLISAREESSKRGILSAKIHSDGKYNDILKTTGGAAYNSVSGFITMEGSEVFRHAVSKLSKVTLEALADAAVNSEEISYIIPHQANQRILDAVLKKLSLPADKLISTVAKHANTSAASIGLAFDDASMKGKFKSGDIIASQAIGGGLTWGSVIIKL